MLRVLDAAGCRIVSADTIPELTVAMLGLLRAGELDSVLSKVRVRFADRPCPVCRSSRVVAESEQSRRVPFNEFVDYAWSPDDIESEGGDVG